MPLVETSALTTLDLLDAIGAFAGAQGFTVNWNVSADGGQVGLSIPAHNFYCAFGNRVGTPSISRDMLVSGGTVFDATIFGTLATALDGAQRYNGGHSGAPGGTSVNSTSHMITNDWFGSFPSVRLFSNPAGDYVHVVAQTGARFSHMSFGLLDSMGFSGDRVPYLTGTFYEFWERNSSPTNINYSPNRPNATGLIGSMNSTSSTANPGHNYIFSLGRGSSNAHRVGYQNHVYLPPNVVDDTLFPGIGGTVSAVQLLQLMSIHNNPSGSSSHPRFIDLAGRTNALSTTIGRSLIDLPVFRGLGYNESYMMLGRYPDVRYVWMDGLNPGQTIEVDDEQWMVFPFKQKGPLSAVASEPGVNTWDYGIAYRVHPS